MKTVTVAKGDFLRVYGNIRVVFDEVRNNRMVYSRTVNEGFTAYAWSCSARDYERNATMLGREVVAIRDLDIDEAMVIDKPHGVITQTKKLSPHLNQKVSSQN